MNIFIKINFNLNQDEDFNRQKRMLINELHNWKIMMKKVMKIIKYENLIYYIYRNIIKFNFNILMILFYTV